MPDTETETFAPDVCEHEFDFDNPPETVGWWGDVHRRCLLCGEIVCTRDDWGELADLGVERLRGLA